MSRSITNSVNVGTFRAGTKHYATVHVNAVVTTTLTEDLSAIEGRVLDSVEFVAHGETVLQLTPTDADALGGLLMTALQVAEAASTNDTRAPDGAEMFDEFLGPLAGKAAKRS